MPSYKTHSIHGEIVLLDIKSEISINKEDYKTFCMGIDTLLISDKKIFKKQHESHVKEYFQHILSEIKKRKLYEDSETMAFIYGQIDHYILDAVTHPLIYHLTENVEKTYLIPPHGLIEMWIDNYICQKYGKEDLFYYRKVLISNPELKQLIDDTYLSIFNQKYESKKYNSGIQIMNIFDSVVRRNLIMIVPLVEKIIKMGKITYSKDYSEVLPYLNLEKELWLNPETGIKSKDSFEELWNKSIDMTLETVEDINKYLYKDKPLRNQFISNDISYNTGLPCSKGQKLLYLKK